MRFIFILSLSFIIGCAATKEISEDVPEPEKQPEYDESFDPLTLNDDDIVIAASTEGQSGTTTGNPVDQEVSDQPKIINGFRVQILATKNIETASLFEQEAAERFQHLDHKTYLLFETPLYKIRVGDCKERSQAEALRDLAVEYGYREAFIVRSKIQIK